PAPTDWPSIASMAGYTAPRHANNLPPAVVLPERLIHWSGRVLPGAYGGQMGRRRDPWFIEASPYGDPFWRGAYPEYPFANETRKPPPRADDRSQDRYGRNSYGWSLLMARRLVEAGVTLVQVNLGNNETWDTHGDAFPRFKNKLFPPTDKALSALLDDLAERGLLDSTLIV